MKRIIFSGSFGAQLADQVAIDYDIDYDYGKELDIDIIRKLFDRAEEKKVYSIEVTDKTFSILDYEYSIEK